MHDVMHFLIRQAAERWPTWSENAMDVDDRADLIGTLLAVVMIATAVITAQIVW